MYHPLWPEYPQLLQIYFCFILSNLVITGLLADLNIIHLSLSCTSSAGHVCEEFQGKDDLEQRDSKEDAHRSSKLTEEAGEGADLVLNPVNNCS